MYCTLFVSGTELQTNGRTIRLLDAPSDLSGRGTKTFWTASLKVLVAISHLPNVTTSSSHNIMYIEINTGTLFVRTRVESCVAFQTRHQLSSGTWSWHILHMGFAACPTGLFMTCSLSCDDEIE